MLALGAASLMPVSRPFTPASQDAPAKPADIDVDAVAQSVRASALWLQGEADATDARLPGHEEKLLRLVDDLRSDLGEPALPFIACTIGEMRADGDGRRNADMNRLLLSLPQKRPHIACVDARELKTHIGDQVHFDTAAQEEIGRRYAAKYFPLAD